MKPSSAVTVRMAIQSIALIVVGVLILFSKPSAARPSDEAEDETVLNRSVRSPQNTLICGNPGQRSSRNFEPSFRILNGTCASYGALPWTAQIQVHVGGNRYKHHCGATIVSEDFVLTAAHCFETEKVSDMRVVVGQGSLHINDAEEANIEIEKHFVHPKWDSPNDEAHSNDIALMKLSKKIKFNDFVLPACLPTKETAHGTDTECIVSGWGQIDDQTEIAEDSCLRYANVPILDDADCKRMYSDSFNKISTGMMCAGYEDGGVDSCFGDSGGPLACRIDERYYIMGVVSWGERCGQARRPGVYSNVKHYLDWISKTIESA